MDVGAPARYEAIELLGRGGMGAVYRANDAIRGHAVALKRLTLNDEIKHREERVALFHREYRTLAELKHPRVIEVFDYGIDAEGPYYTMELLDGADLSGRVPVPWREACSLARDVCSSLALLHSRGYVHRDVSPLNVRCTGDGRAKLIDFGAMVPMGISTLTMGTPPCVAPEALAREPLDGRTDLFALGATLYFTLTGRHAFPARNLMQLVTLQQRVPRPPSAYVPDVPVALDRLVLSLLMMDPMARPRHAAEVMERLTIVAELAPLEQSAVQSSYLNTPALVGRQEQIASLSKHLKKCLAGQGSVVRLHAAEGGGRSRALSAAVMEARLAGALTLYVGCGDTANGPYTVMRALLTDLRNSGEVTNEQHFAKPALQALLDPASTLADDALAREALLKELSRLVVDLARNKPLVIAVDDIDRCDEPSRAALLTMASFARRAALALIYTDTSTGSAAENSAHAVLHEMSEAIALPALGLDHSEALLGSVFGQVPNLATVARYVFDRAAGNPRSTMELAQALVERGFARYELGSWTLPGELAADALPASLSDVRRTKLESLDADARELAEVLAIADGYALQLDELCSLTDHAAALRFSAANDALLDQRVVEPGDTPVLADRSWLEIVRQGTSDARQRQLYARLSRVLEARAAHTSLVARCLLRAGDEARGLDVLCAALATETLVDTADSDYAELLLEAERCCVRLSRPRRDGFLVQRELLGLSDRVVLGGLDGYFLKVLAQLSHDSGLDDYLKLRATVPADQLLAQALTAAQARYDAADPSERVLAPIDAVRGLVETVYAASVYAAVIGDCALIDALPSLAPLEPLSPAISAVQSAIKAQRALIGARYEEALELYRERLDALDKGVNAANLSEAQLTRSRLLLLYALGALQAGLGIKGALELAERLEQLPNGQIMAAAVRENYYVRRGNTRGAQQWRRRRELLQIQHRRPHALKLRQATQQLECSAHADDLEETKRNLEVLEEMAQLYPSAMPYVHFGRAEYERIRGDYASGLKHVRLALAATRPGVHPVWPWAAGCEIECLQHLHELTGAREVGLRRVTEATEAGLRVMRDHIETFLAVVEGQLGMFDSAVERLDRGIEYREFYGMYGLNLGWSYEARARVSLWMADRDGFERCVRRCADHYQSGRDNPALAARYQQLIHAAQAAWEGLPDVQLAGSEATSTLAHSSVVMPEHVSMLQTLVGCRDREQRAQLVLQHLLMAANCQDGQLYLLRDEGVTLAAGSDPPAELTSLVERMLDIDDADEQEHTATGDEPTQLATTQGLRSLRPVLLTCMRNNHVATVGVVALRSERPITASMFYTATRELSSALIELGDVKPKIG